MQAAIRALAWELCAPLQWGFWVYGVYVLLATLVVALVPEWMPVDWAIGAWLATPLASIGLVLVCTVAHGHERIDLLRTASGYPRRLFTLPVPNHVLAGVPLVLGTLLVFVLWVPVALGLLRPCEPDVPLLLPGLVAAACLAWVQVLVWAPFPITWLRTMLLTILLWGLPFAALVLAKFGVHLDLLSAAAALLLALAYPAALAAVASGRRNGGPVHFDLLIFRDKNPTLTPFRSSLGAQVWLECRHAWVGFVAIGGVSLMVLLPMVYMAEFAQRERPYVLEYLAPGFAGVAQGLGSAWLALGFLLFPPFLLALFGGGDFGRLSDAQGASGLPSFHATRPISTPQMVKAKVIFAALLMAGIWAIEILVGAGWAVLAGHAGDMMERLRTVSGSTGAGLAILGGGLLAAYVVSWLLLTSSLWVGLAGRQWLPVAYMLAGSTFWTLAVFVAVYWRPAWLPLLVTAVAVGLLLKVASVVWVCRRLLEKRLAGPRALMILVSTWLLFAAVLGGVAPRLVAGGWLAAACVVVVLPLAECLAAPLALAWNRHR